MRKERKFKIGMINKSRLEQEFMTLVQLDSPSRKERKVADYLLQKLADMGYKAFEDNAGSKFGGDSGNVIVNVQGNTSAHYSVMFSAHMDCVDPCIGVKPKLVQGIFTADGTTVLGGDDKSGVAAMLEVLQIIKEQQLPHGDLKFIFSPCEEQGLEGPKNMEAADMQADMGYILDADGPIGTFATAAPGYYDLKITVEGRKAHAGINPEDGCNAIIIAAKALAQFPQGRIDEETTANIGLISGGTARNIVADKVEIVGELRSIDMQKLESLLVKVRNIFENTVAQAGGTLHFEAQKMYSSYRVSEEAPVVQIARKATEALGLEFKTATTGGASDANVYNNRNIPAIVMAIGMSKVHTTQEYLRAEDLYQTAEVTLSIIKSVLK